MRQMRMVCLIVLPAALRAGASLPGVMEPMHAPSGIGVGTDRILCAAFHLERYDCRIHPAVSLADVFASQHAEMWP